MKRFVLRDGSCNIQETVHSRISVTHRFRLLWFVLKFLDYCSGQVEDVPPVLTTMGYGCTGLAMLPLELPRFVSTVLSPQ